MACSSIDGKILLCYLDGQLMVTAQERRTMSHLEVAVEAGKAARRYSFRREVLYTHLHVFYLSMNDSARVPCIADAIEFSLNEVENIRERLTSENKAIDWVALSLMSPSSFGVPDFLSHGRRFQTTVTLSSDVDDALSEFVKKISPEFTGLEGRSPYRPFAVALLFRAVIANELGKLPTKDEDQDL